MQPPWKTEMWWLQLYFEILEKVSWKAFNVNTFMKPHSSLQLKVKKLEIVSDPNSFW